MASNWRDRAKASLEKKEVLPVVENKADSSWKAKAQKSLDNRGYVPEAPKKEIDWLSKSGALKKELATALSSGAFDAEEMRPLVENYAGVQFKLFDENLKKGETVIKPVGENLSNLFKAHGYDFNELYPDLSKDFSTGNIEGYAYYNSDNFKKKYDEKYYHDATKDVITDSYAAQNKKNQHERNAEKIAAEEKEKAAAYNAELERLNGEVDWSSLTPDERLGVSNKNKIIAMQNTGYYKNPVGFGMTPEEAAERKAAADASKEQIYANEALYASKIMRDVMSRPDFEEKSKYDFWTTPVAGPTTTGLDKNFISQNSFESVEFDDGTKADIHARGFTEDQYKVYMYLLNTEGVEAATRFENGIKNTLNSMGAERASQIFQDMEKGNPLEKVASGIGQAGYAFASGVEGVGQAFKGIGDTFTGDTEYFMPGVAQQVTAKNKENTSSLLGKLSLGATEAIPQVLGVAATGAINPYLGAAFLGATAYGSGYTDAKNSGATQAQAIGMGIASAALEIALEKYVGNTIEGFGTSLSGKAASGLSKTKLGQKFITSFDNFAKVHPKRAVALATVGNMFGNSSSEFVEEYLAETASPLLRNVFLGENKDFTLWSDEQKEAGLIGFITGGILEGARGGITLSNLGTDYGVRVETIKAMSDGKALSEYKAKFGSDAESADKARAFLIESERFIASTVAVSEYAKEGLSYEEAIEKAKKQGVDVSGFEEFTKAAYDIGRTGAVSPAGLSEKLTYKGGAYSDIGRLIGEGEATSYIADRIAGLDKSVPRSEAINAVNKAKQRAFAQSLENTTMSDFEKSNAMKEYVLKEQALDRMYKLGTMGLKFDSSMGAGLISEADAHRAFTRGENAAKAQREAAEKVKAAADARIFDEAPTAPVMAEDAKAFGDVTFEDGNSDERVLPQSAEADSSLPEGAEATANVNTVISDMGGYGRTLYNKILNPIAKNATKREQAKAAIEGFAHVYESGFKGVNYKRSKAGPLQIKEINAIYAAGKKDAAARVKVKKKTDAKVIKDESFKAAKVSKRSERILDGVSKIIGRDIRFSDKLEANAKIDFESGEIIISTKAKQGHTWAMIHEVYHALVMDSPAEAEQLKKTVLDIARKNPESYDRFRKKYEIVYSSELFDENNKMRLDAVEYISEEMVADLVGYTLSKPAILEKLTGQQRNVLQKFVDKLVSMFGNADAELKKEYRDRFGGDIRAIFKDVAREADSIAEQFKAAIDTSQKAEKNTVERDGVRNSKDITETAKISMEMTDSERANVLKNKHIIAPFYEGQVDELISLNKSQLESEKLGLVKKAILIIAENFAPLNTSIDITDAEVSVVLSKSNLKESVTKDVTPEQLAKLLPILKETLSSAIAIERHNNRYFFDSDTVYFDNLFGGYIDGIDFVPVRFGLKHSKTGKTTLYVVVDQNKVPIKLLKENKKTEVVKTAGSIKTNQTASRSVTYSLSEIIPFVNSKDVLRYFPDDMLNEEQNKTKWQAIAETIKKTGEKNDKKYAEYIAVGNLSAANEMIREAAKYNGYTISAYHGGDQFFTEFSKGNKTSSAPEGAYFFTDNEDVAYSYTVYKNKVDLNKQNYPVYKQATPEGKIEENRVMHGGVYPVYLKIDNPYIVDFEGRNWGNKVDGMDINETVKWAMENNYNGVIAKNIIDPGDMGDVNYEIGNTRIPSTDFAIFDSTNAKSSEPIAYDDNGNVIPLSERFNPEKKDIRWSKELFPDDRTMSAEEIERDEIEQYIQQIKSSDDLSDADVQAIRQEIIQSRKQQREQLLAEIATTNLARWGADLGRQEESGKVISINEAIKKVEESFGVKVTSGGDASVAGSNVSSYNESTRTIRTKFKNDLPAVCHALGYHIDKKLGVVDKAIEQTAEVRRQNGDGEGILEQELKRMVKLEGKDSRKAIKEGFAEFIRMYLVAKNLAQEAAPIFYSEFESMLKEDAELQKAVETSAEVVHGYFVQSAGDRGGAAVMTAEDWKQFNKPRGKEAIRTARDWVIVRLFDRFYGIKSAEKEQNVFDLSTSKSAYVKATLSLTARAKAARLLDDGFYDANGNKVGEGFFDIIEELGAEYTDKFKAFGDYLSFVHALEWIEPNKVAGKKTSSGKDIYNAKAKGKVFADETLNDATELKRLIADMESKHPDFKGIAERIYKYQDNLMNYYLVPSGALSRDQAETFKAQYPHYVPFNRFNTVFGEATKSGKGGNKYFGNLKNPIQKADGGNAPIRHPLESIINSTFSAVDFYMKNDTMKAMIEEFTGNGALPGVMERIYSTEELKKLDEKGNNPFDVEEGKTIDESKETAFSPVIDKEKGIVYAWVNGEKRFYQIYDRGLYNAVANLEVQNLRGLWTRLNTLTNILKVTMTMRNPLFGPGNFYRDFMTFHYNTTSNANILMQLGMYAGALKSIIKKDTDYQLYKALGGGDMGKFTADMDAIKRTVARRNSKAIKWSEMSARDFGEKVIKNIVGLKFLWDKFFELNDVFEALPRLAEFKYTMENTHGDEQLAMYRSQDVTTNFSRSGSWGRKLNAIFLFSNAELQGIDKMVRNYTEAAYTEKGENGEPNKAIIAGKILKTVGWSFFMMALQEFINRRDDEAEEEYARLSEFIKNNYDVFYIGNGYFAKVPKEQNLTIPRTVMQRIFDAVKGDDVDFREIGSYIWDGITPGFVPDIFDIKNVPHQIANNTPISVFTDVMANRDFKGAEIVPSYLDGPEYLKYNNYTSALSVGLAKSLYEKTGFDISPMALDHYIGAFGYWGTLFTDLFPHVDYSERGFWGSIGKNWFNALGVKTKFSVDARYSTDLLNDFYKGRDRAEARLGIEANGENRLVNERYKVLGSFIKSYNKQSRTGSEEQQRLDRRMLQVILEGFDEGNFSEGEEYVMKLYEATGNEAVFVSSFPGPELRETKTKKGKKIITTAILDANAYAEYCAEISRMREAVRVLIRDLGLDETDAAELLAKEYSNINDDVKAKYLLLYGKTEETVAEKKEKKFDEKAYEKAYEDALNNKIYGD